MIFENLEQLKKGVRAAVKTEGGRVEVADPEKLRGRTIDDLIHTAVFSPDPAAKEVARWIIRRAGAALGIHCASIQGLYEAMGKEKAGGFTVPAVNLRGLTYLCAQAVFRTVLKEKIGPVIFEIARSEIGYTDQRPAEYGAAVTAAAIKTGYSGPLFLQGDHFQVSGKKYAGDPEGEVNAVRVLIREAVAAGFFNIDIDSSTIVDLSKPTLREQQLANSSIAADLTGMIRRIEPAGVRISVGGEIGEVGKKNSTVEDLRAFMEIYQEKLHKEGKGLAGISKISVQTGTTHGGVPLPDGRIADVKLDFQTLELLSRTARSEFGLAGAVQHGASTLPDEAFDRFPKTGTAEIHLATGFQNMIYDSSSFPHALRDRIYAHIRSNLADERGPKDTEEQFIYKTRKKGFGPFKKDFWMLPPECLEGIGAEMEKKFHFLFGRLNVFGTKDVTDRFVKPVDVASPLPAALSGKAGQREDIAEEYGEGE
ncbi:MAG: class II fructose-bisphosphate aldolase [Syntrophales bacterium]|nr:class II fructose-bisphosphate aldolase [Syntrophales bacterium]